MRDASETSFFYSSFDGLQLHARIWKIASQALPVVCLPGLTRNARDFEGLAAALSQGVRPRMVAAFDYRGRGLSDADPNWRNYSVATEARDVVTGLAGMGVGRAVFVGTSRGGLILHLLATSHPNLVVAAVLNDVGPELGRAGLAQIKAYLSRREEPASLEEAVSFQRATHGPAFPALSEADWFRFTRALYREAAGRPIPDYDPALLKTLDGLDPSGPLPDLWLQFDALAKRPLLAIRGEHSHLLTPETLSLMQRRCPAMEVETVQGQGHAPLLDTAGLPERIAAFAAAAEAQLRQ